VRAGDRFESGGETWRLDVLDLPAAPTDQVGMGILGLGGLVADGAFAQVQFLDEPGVPQEDERSVDGWQVQAWQAPGQPRADLLGGQMIAGLVQDVPDELTLGGEPRASRDHLSERMMAHEAPPDQGTVSSVHLHCQCGRWGQDARSVAGGV
jgi:hypothetical protein